MKSQTSSRVLNCYYNIKGEIKKVEFNTNAVLVHLFPEVDNEGNQYYKKVITIACMDQNDKGLVKALEDEARRILYGK